MAAVTAALIAAGTAAYSANRQKKAAADAAKLANQPTTSNTTINPYAPYQQNLDVLQRDTLLNYFNQRDNAAPPPTRGGYDPGPSVSGASDLENQLANSAGQRAMGQNQLLDSASGSLQNLYGGGAHPLLQGAYGAAQNFSNPYLDEQTRRQMRGSGSRASGLLEGLYADWSNPNAMALGESAYDQYYSQNPRQGRAPQAGGGDPFAGMTSSSAGPQGSGITSAGAWSRAAPMGGGGQAGPKSPMQEAYEAEMLRTMRGEYQHADSNPYLQEQIDQAKRDADAALAARSTALGAAGDGLGRFGSSPYMAMQRQNEALYNQEYLDRAGDLRFENYGMERGFMQNALDRMLAQNNAEMSDRTARAGISASSRSQSDALSAQLSMARDQNRLQALGQLGALEGQNQNFLGNLLGTQSQLGLGALNTQAGLGQAAAGNQISALGLAPGISDSYYTGYGVAGGLAGQVRQGNQAAQSANQAAAAAAADARYQDEMARWAWDQEHQWNNLRNLSDLSMGPAQAFGTQQGTNQGYRVSPQNLPDPWASALTTGLGTYLAFQNQGAPSRNTTWQTQTPPPPIIGAGD